MTFQFGVCVSVASVQFHGLSQALVGLALYYLWQLVPMNMAKKDEDNGEQLLETSVHAGEGLVMKRVMSTHDLPVARLEYY